MSTTSIAMQPAMLNASVCIGEGRPRCRRRASVRWVPLDAVNLQITRPRERRGQRRLCHGQRISRRLDCPSPLLSPRLSADPSSTGKFLAGLMSHRSDPLSRRERQIMDIIYARGQATAAEVTAALADPPSYSAVRALLRILEQKGHLRHQEDGPRYVFLPTVSRDRARRSALRSLVKTFFDGSPAQAAAALIDQARDV